MDPLHTSLFFVIFAISLPNCANLLLPFEISFNPDEIKFLIINSQSGLEEIRYLDTASLNASPYRPGELTVFLIHGFLTQVNLTGNNGNFANNWMTSFNPNIIFMDWSALSGKIIFPLDFAPLYFAAKSNLETAGKRMVNFIQWLDNEGVIDLDKIHVIGTSLGAQLAGRVGRDFQLAMGGRKIPRISGLDPAGPFFYPSLPEWIIDKSDAYFVDLYHSNAGEFGTDRLDGHADFIINNGQSQPGCNAGSNILFCSHQTAQYLFADSIDNAYVACQCSQRELDLKNFEICVGQCPNPVFAGIYTPHTARGQYYIDVPYPLKSPPFLSNYFFNTIPILGK